MGCVPYQINARFNSSSLPFSSGFGFKAWSCAQRHGLTLGHACIFLRSLLGESKIMCEESCFLVCAGLCLTENCLWSPWLVSVTHCHSLLRVDWMKRPNTNKAERERLQITEDWQFSVSANNSNWNSTVETICLDTLGLHNVFWFFFLLFF